MMMMVVSLMLSLLKFNLMKEKRRFQTKNAKKKRLGKLSQVKNLQNTDPIRVKLQSTIPTSNRAFTLHTLHSNPFHVRQPTLVP